MNKILPKHWKMPSPDKMDHKSRLLYSVNSVAEMLLTSDEDDFENSLREAMALMARCMEIDRIYIWRNKLVNGSLQYIQQFSWLDNYASKGETVRSQTGFSYTDSLPEWEKKFLRGECINGPLSSLTESEHNRLEPYGIKSILVLPVFLQDHFWGFVSFDDCHKERFFTTDEISILHSANLMLASAMDRHQTAAKMRETDEHAKLMLDATPLCCSLWDANFNIIDCNAEVVNFFGIKHKHEYIDGFYDFSPECQPDGSSSREKALEYIEIAFRDGRISFDWTHQMPDGTPMPVEVTIVRVRRGDEFIVVGYTRDLREHKKMMNAIEYKDNLLHTVNEVATILLQSEINEFKYNLWQCMSKIADSVRVDRMYIWKNHINDGELCCTQLYEWSDGAEPQQSSELTVDISYSLVPNWEQKLSGGQCINSLVRCLTQEEQAFLIPQGIQSILIVPVFLRDQFWGFVGFDDCHRERVFTETEESILRSGSLLIANALLRNEMTNEIHAAVERAQAASKAKSAFLAHMSHEIRTPMNVIAGMTELILRENMPDTIYEHVLGVKQASASMLSLVNDVLDFSKIEAGTLDIAASEYSLTSLINDILIIIRMKVSEKHIMFTVNIDSNIPNRLIGDETRLRQILLNALDNAAKYTTVGFISLSVTGEINEDTVILTAEVSDSGIGIRQENMAKLFDDFMRFDGERNKSVQGTGLGLAITSSLCKAMGGSINVRSDYGVGSTFTITISQKIKSYEEKFAVVSDPDFKRVLLYETRNIYSESIIRSLDNLGVSYSWAKNQKMFHEELKCRYYPFVFVSSALLESARQVIEELKTDTKLVLLAEFGDAPAMRGVRTIAMPVHSASIANILDDIEDNIFYNESGQETAGFIAPTVEILVVDDLSTNLKVAQGLMLPYQMQVDTCESGEEAIEYAQRKRYDIIFMDHMMPGMNGIETTCHIRSLEDGSGYYEKVPIISLTANAVSGVKEMFLKNGMNDFLAKPIDVTKLHCLLDKWIPQGKKEKFRKTRAKRPANKKLIPFQSFQIEGVDVRHGIAMTGGTVDDYIKILSIFYTDATDKLSKMHKCIEKSDIEQYVIYVHAMKSAVASIGAFKLSEAFTAHEAAGKKGDLAYIRENRKRLFEKFELLLGNIQTVISKYQSEPVNEDDPKLIVNELLKLKEALIIREAGHIEDIMNILETVKWSQWAVNKFNEVSMNIVSINYMDAILLIDELLTVYRECMEAQK